MKIIWTKTAQTDLEEIHSMSHRIIYSISSGCIYIVTIVHMARSVSDFEA